MRSTLPAPGPPRSDPASAPPVHLVELYGSDEARLVTNVARYLADGAQRGQTLLAVATPQRQSALLDELSRLGVPARAYARSGRLFLLDAEATLASLLVDGYPEWEPFDETVGVIAEELTEASGGRGLRAYGEMVGLLWQAGRYPAAIRLEHLWNRLQRTVPLDLYCAYPIDVFGPDFEVGLVGGLFCSHSAMVGSDSNDELAGALYRAVAETTGVPPTPAEPVAGRAGAWSTLPTAERTIIWLRSNLPERADEILRVARSYYATG